MAKIQSTPQARRHAPKTNKSRLILLTLFSAILVGLSVILGSRYLNDSPASLFNQTDLTEMSEAQLKLINANDYLTAYQMTSTIFQQGVTVKKFQDFLTPLAHSSQINFVANHIDGHFGYVAATLQTDKNEALKVEWQYIKENKDWKIQAVRFSNIQPDDKSANSNASSTHLLTP